MPDPAPMLDWIDAQAPAMRDRLAAWSAVNSGTDHAAGVAAMARLAAEALRPFADEVHRVELPPVTELDDRGETHQRTFEPAVVATTRPEAARRALLVIHLDTVYGRDHPFQRPEPIDADRLRGPGVADAKGGLVVMLTALEAVERFGLAGGLGWTVALNPDEEVGSPASGALLRTLAKSADAGLVYEPALPDGSLIGARKGSANYHILLRGRSAHAGRDFASGRSAVHAAGRLIAALDALNGRRPGVTVNVGRVVGGGALNTVADTAVVRVNARAADDAGVAAVEAHVGAAVAEAGREAGITAERRGGFHNPPKPMAPAAGRLFQAVAACGETLGLTLTWHDSGGVCDGNKLAAAGLPTVDTLGVVGGAIHSPEEYAELPSLPQRAKLSALLLTRLAAGKVSLDSPAR